MTRMSFLCDTEVEETVLITQVLDFRKGQTTDPDLRASGKQSQSQIFRLLSTDSWKDGGQEQHSGGQ